jgi:hypothetical protein
MGKLFEQGKRIMNKAWTDLLRVARSASVCSSIYKVHRGSSVSLPCSLSKAFGEYTPPQEDSMQFITN